MRDLTSSPPADLLKEGLQEWPLAAPLGRCAARIGARLLLADGAGQVHAVLGEEAGGPRRLTDVPETPGLCHRRTVEVYGEAVATVVGLSDKPKRELAELVELAASALAERLRSLAETDGLSRELLNAYEELNFFHTFAQTVAHAGHRSGLCQLVLEKVLELIPAGRGAIFLFDEKVGRLDLVAASSEELRRAGLEGRAARTLWSVYHDVRPILVETPGEAEEPVRSELGALGAGSMLAVPLTVPTDGPPKALGVLLLLDRTDGQPFQSPDLKVAEAAAGQMGAVLNIVTLLELEREVQLARDLQSVLLPSSLPEPPGLAIAGRCVAAKNVGGDYYDVFLRRDGTLDVVIADVSGHSLASGLLMTAARTLFRCSSAGGAAGPAAVLARANQLLHTDLVRAEQFISVFYLRYNPVARALAYANAGHNPPLLWRARTRNFELLTGDGMLLGILPEQRIGEKRTTLARDDVLVLYTDGVIEAKDRNGAFYGEERLQRLVAEQAEAGPEELVGALFRELQEWAQGTEQSDDVTVVVLKATEGGEAA